MTYDRTKGAQLAIGLVFPAEPGVYRTEFRVEAVSSFTPNGRHEVFAKKRAGGGYAVDLCGGTAAIAREQRGSR